MDPTTDPTKPGYLTSEFWTVVFTQIVAAVVTIAALFGKHLDGSALQPLIGLGSILAMAIAAGWYSHSRGKVKVGISSAIAAMPAAQLPDGSFDVSTLSNGGAPAEDRLDDSEQAAAMGNRAATQ